MYKNQIKLMKNSTKIAIAMLFIISIALFVIALGLLNKLNTTVVLVVVVICSAIFLATYFVWKAKSDKLEIEKIIELQGKVKNKTTRNIIKIISLAIMAGVIFSITLSPINNYYVIIYIVVHIVLTNDLTTPKRLVINNNAINCLPNWKVKWSQLKGYQLDRNEGILKLEKVDGKIIQVKKIKEEDYEVIESMIKKYESKGQKSS
jgi:amino acid transporter